MKALAAVALTVAGLAGLISLGRGPSLEAVAALAVALPAAGWALRATRRRDPHDFDTVVAVGGVIAAMAYGGLALNGRTELLRGIALAIAALCGAAMLFAIVELALRGRREGPVPDLLRQRFPPRDLVETEGVQWALRPPERPAGARGATELLVALQNTWDAQRDVTLQLSLPAGFEAGAAQLLLRPLEAGVLHVTLEAGPEARGGRARAWLAVRGDGGRRLRPRRYREVPPRPGAAAKAVGLLLALRNPLELLLSLAEPAVRFRLEAAPERRPASPSRGVPAAWWEAWEAEAPSRAAQAADAFRRR